MENFIKLIQEKDKEITNSDMNKELKNFEKILEKLEVEHTQIKEDISTIDYLLDLIEKYPIEVESKNDVLNDKKTSKKWLKELESTFEKFHLMHSDKVSNNDIEYLKTEKSKLLAEKSRLEKEHKNLHDLIAKTTIQLMEVREAVCKILSKGHSISDVGEKLMEHFGKKIDNEFSYGSGRRKIIRFLEDTFLINKIQSKGIFEILEKSKILNFKLELPKNNILFQNKDLASYANGYIPLVSNWYINS